MPTHTQRAQIAYQGLGAQIPEDIYCGFWDLIPLIMGYLDLHGVCVCVRVSTCVDLCTYMHGLFTPCSFERSIFLISQKGMVPYQESNWPMMSSACRILCQGVSINWWSYVGRLYMKDPFILRPS